MSLMDIAKAFDAPLLKAAGSNVMLCSGKSLSTAGKQRVRYGRW
jgi:hypothetical protein